MSSSQMNNKIIKQNKINFQKLHLNKLEEYVLSKKKKKKSYVYIYTHVNLNVALGPKIS